MNEFLDQHTASFRQYNSIQDEQFRIELEKLTPPPPRPNTTMMRLSLDKEGVVREIEEMEHILAREGYNCRLKDVGGGISFHSLKETVMIIVKDVAHLKELFQVCRS